MGLKRKQSKQHWRKRQPLLSSDKLAEAFAEQYDLDQSELNSNARAIHRSPAEKHLRAETHQNLIRKVSSQFDHKTRGIGIGGIVKATKDFMIKLNSLDLKYRNNEISHDDYVKQSQAAIGIYLAQAGTYFTPLTLAKALTKLSLFAAGRIPPNNLMAAAQQQAEKDKENATRRKKVTQILKYRPKIHATIEILQAKGNLTQVPIFEDLLIKADQTIAYINSDAHYDQSELDILIKTFETSLTKVANRDFDKQETLKSDVKALAALNPGLSLANELLSPEAGPVKYRQDLTTLLKLGKAISEAMESDTVNLNDLRAKITRFEMVIENHGIEAPVLTAAQTTKAKAAAIAATLPGLATVMLLLRKDPQLTELPAQLAIIVSNTEHITTLPEAKLNENADLISGTMAGTDEINPEQLHPVQGKTAVEAA